MYQFKFVGEIRRNPKNNFPAFFWQQGARISDFGPCTRVGHRGIAQGRTGRLHSFLVSSQVEGRAHVVSVFSIPEAASVQLLSSRSCWAFCFFVKLLPGPGVVVHHILACKLFASVRALAFMWLGVLNAAANE